MDWDKLKLFQAVAEAGSFTGAAERLHLSQSALSRQIRTLEESLNVSLFTRHARGLALTAEGEQLMTAARQVTASLSAVEDSLLEAKAKPKGPLKITTTQTFGAFWLTPRLGEFVAHYPEIDVELVLNDQVIDLAKREADVAIRFREPEQADLVQRKLVQVSHHVYASPKYIKRKGMPECTADLDYHDLVVFGPSAPAPIKNIDWILDVGRPKGAKRRKPVLQINSLFGVLKAVTEGIGISPIPDYLAASEPGLVRVLPDLKTPDFTAYLVYMPEMRRSKRLQVFRDFLVAKVREDRGLL